MYKYAWKAFDVSQIVDGILVHVVHDISAQYQARLTRQSEDVLHALVFQSRNKKIRRLHGMSE